MWPEISEIGFVTGRAANRDDIAAGRAAFVLEREGRPIGRPIDIPIPQYAYHVDVDTKVKSPCILIQAEEAQGNKVVGLLELPERTFAVATLAELELLGRERPK